MGGKMRLLRITVLGSRIFRLSMVVIILLGLSFLILKYVRRSKNTDVENIYFGLDSEETWKSSSNDHVQKLRPDVVRKAMNPLAMRPIVFIGGYARSGTKILKKLIERLTQTKCNAETRVITDLFGLLIKWKQNQKEVVRLREAGVDDSVLLDSIGSFAKEIVLGQKSPDATTICVEESLSYKYVDYLKEIFPKAKFVFAIRDGRTVIHSLITKRSFRESERFGTYGEGFRDWEREMQLLLKQSRSLPPEKFHLIRLEDIFLSPKDTSVDLLTFLGHPIDLEILDHVSSIMNANVSYAFDYLASRQKIPQGALNEAVRIAPTLEDFGYDPKFYVSGNSAQKFKT